MVRHRTLARLITLSIAAALAWGCHDVVELDPCESLDCGHGQCVSNENGHAECQCDQDFIEDGLYCRYQYVSEEYRFGTNMLDLLFVMDNTLSMGERQTALGEQVPAMIRELLQPSETVSGRTPPPVEDLHVGIISADMGSGGYRVAGCPDPIDGDDGVLQSAGRLPGCLGTYTAADCPERRDECPWLSHSRTNPDDGSEPENPPIWEDFRCIASLGTEGCGWEQPLEAMIEALTTHSESSGPNEGFLRSDALLAVVFVTDEDDCSAADTSMYDSTNDALGGMNVRCALEENQDMLHPVSRYREILLDLKDGDEEMVVVAAVAGFPTDWDGMPGSAQDLADLVDYIYIDDEPAMMAPLCDNFMGPAHPSVRIAELIESFEFNGSIASICNEDWAGVLTPITEKIQASMAPMCLELLLDMSGSSGYVWDAEACRVVELIPIDETCPHLADPPDGSRTTGWHRDIGEDLERGRRRCEILPADYSLDGCPDPLGSEVRNWCNLDMDLESLEGWIFNTVALDGDYCTSVGVTHGVVFQPGSIIQVECVPPE